MEKKDLETIKKVFELLSKAKWNDCDGDFIISSYTTIFDFKKLEDKVKKMFDPPKIEPSKVITEPPPTPKIKKEKKQNGIS